LLLVLSCVFALLVGLLGIRNALAAHFLGLDTRDGYERAVRLEPRNPRNWYLLGRSYLYDLEQPDPEKAVSALRKSVELDPYSAEAMLDLAIAYDSEGDSARARLALEEAQRVYPLSADVSWSFGNFLLRRGDQNGAFAQFYKTLQLDPKRAADVVRTERWRRCGGDFEAGIVRQHVRPAATRRQQLPDESAHAVLRLGIGGPRVCRLARPR